MIFGPSVIVSWYIKNSSYIHCVRSVRILNYSGPCFPAFGLNMERYGLPYSVRMQENTDQNNSKYGHFSRSDCDNKTLHLYISHMEGSHYF